MATRQLGLASLGPSVYLPSLLFGIGQGAIAPVIAVSARELGASVATAAMVVAAVGIGRLLGDVPAGRLVQRIGERAVMLVSLGISLIALVSCIAAPSVPMLALGVAGTGVATAAFTLARHAYVTDLMPYALRARALATLAGTLRIGLFVGPFVGALVISGLGTDGAYWLAGIMSAAAAVSLLVVPEPPAVSGDGRELRRDASDRGYGVLTVVRDHAKVLRTLGIGVLIIGSVRASRQAVLPLWADHIGLEPATISLVFAVSGAAEAALFYPGGLVMDRLGRRWIVVPATVILGSSLAVLPLASSVESLAAVAVSMGVGNGLGSGINMIIGSDVAPTSGRASFLGVWRLFADLGAAGGPLLISGLAAATTLGIAITATGATGLVAAAFMARWLPRPTR